MVSPFCNIYTNGTRSSLAVYNLNKQFVQLKSAPKVPWSVESITPRASSQADNSTWASYGSNVGFKKGSKVVLSVGPKASPVFANF